MSERVLVLVDTSPATPRALRRAAATAAVLRAPLLALVVETPADAAASSEQTRRIREYLDDATDLGAEIVDGRGVRTWPTASSRSPRRAA